ncbi:MAG: hypothetical protein HKN22_06125, partial [Bacteroidia bacterium]|nr:hypothetical protein [Bacteroidia bacterium]
MANKVEDLTSRLNTVQDPSEKVLVIVELVEYYKVFTDDPKIIDSLGNTAIRIAKASGDNDLLLIALNQYFENNQFLELNTVAVVRDSALNNALLARSIIVDRKTDELKWRTQNNLALVYKSSYLLDDAHQYASLALASSEKIKSVNLKALSLITLATCHEADNQMLLALQHYHKALDIAESLNDKILLNKCYNELSRFYNLNKIYKQSIIYKNKQKDLALNDDPIDSLKIMWIVYQLEEISYYSNNNIVSMENLHKVIDFAKRHGNNRLKNAGLALFRAHFIIDDRRAELYDLYIKTYPEELEKLKVSKPAMYNRLYAFFSEVEGNNALAYQYYLKAEPHVLNNPNKINQANFYRRFGEFLHRDKKNSEAIAKFNMANKLASEVSYFEYMTDISRQIESLYADNGDYYNAYQFLQKYIVARDSMVYFKNEQEIDRRVMQYDFAKSQLSDSLANAIEKSRLELEFQTQVGKQRTQKILFLAGGSIFILLAAGLYFRLKLVRKTNSQLEEKNIEIEYEKGRSDDLLLNILPLNVAEELKEEGKTKARYFDEAHIMFTDFKEFTAITEKMNAEDLVKVIDKHFQKFDEITDKYGIEKIKTIGDSYMAVGGLPEIGTCSAKDVVKAALEMQDYLEKQKSNRGAFLNPYFEMRIGIHSGSVVAGVVGRNKFQYDIWGDAVNLASRLESSGETGRVNISQAT